MRYMGEKLGYWECVAQFPAQKGQIEIFVDGAKDSPLEHQHTFFLTICEEWPQLREGMQEKLKLAYEQATGKPLASPVWEEFTMDSLSVPDATVDSAEWRISFTAKSDEGHSYWIEMKGRAPEIVSWDS